MERFGGIDICINNASAVKLSSVADLPVKRFDLVKSVNVPGMFVVTQACLPHLRRSDHAHVLTISPPLNLDLVWFAPSAYTVLQVRDDDRHARRRADRARAPGRRQCLWR